MLRPPPLHAVCIALLLGAAAPAHAGIYRCTAPGGEVTYQQSPCAPSDAVRVVDVPESYPTADSRERERLFAREAALDQRLEARRERESREAAARAAAATPAPTPQAPQAQPQVAWILPPFFAPPRHGFVHRRVPTRIRGY